MVRNVYIKLTKVGPNAGPFNIYDQWNNLIAENVSRQSLIDGVGYLLNSDITMIKLVSIGDCSYEKTIFITFVNTIEEPITEAEFFNIPTTIISTACLYRHLTDPVNYNYYYGVINPYIIEHSFAYEYHDEIVQNIKSYDRVYRYLPNVDGMPSANNRIELDNEYFNKAIVYNGQQCSGMLELTTKPLHNLQSYMTYPIYNTDSKTITYTKSNSFYQINTFWDILKDKGQQMFIRSCESLSIDKILNTVNMDYGRRSFTKAPLRAKETKVRYILDNQSDIHIVSRFIYEPAMISYK
jgi:hypothetical protein